VRSSKGEKLDAFLDIYVIILMKSMIVYQSLALLLTLCFQRKNSNIFQVFLFSIHIFFNSTEESEILTPYPLYSKASLKPQTFLEHILEVIHKNPRRISKSIISLLSE